MIKFITDELHLLLVPSIMSKERFLKNAKVKDDSYMFRFLEQIYIALTSCGCDLKLEYEKFYPEYDTFHDFLYRKYPKLTDEELASISEKLENGYILLKSFSRKAFDYNCFQLFEDDEFEIKILRLLECDENQD